MLKLLKLETIFFSALAALSRERFIRILDRETGKHNPKMKKALGEMQTLRAGCSKAEPKKIAPPQTPFPGARDGQNLISWRWR